MEPADAHDDALLARRIARFGEATAVIDPDGAHSYAVLARGAAELARRLLDDRTDLSGDRVAILARPGRDFVTALLGTWLAGGLAVPLHPDHPTAELAYVLAESGAPAVVASDVHRHAAEAVAPGRSVLVAIGPEDVPTPTEVPTPLPSVDPDRPALMVFTSGTTGKPKGAVHTHASVAAQITGMVEAWGWRPDDRVLLVLPLHHVHGIVNVTLCPLWVGAQL